VIGSDSGYPIARVWTGSWGRGAVDLPPSSRTSVISRKSVTQENDGHEEEQIIVFIKQAEAGVPIKELCRKGSFSDATFYKWRAKFGGMEVPDAKRLRELEGENAKLKKLLAEAHLHMHALKSVLGGFHLLMKGSFSIRTMLVISAMPYPPNSNWVVFNWPATYTLSSAYRAGLLSLPWSAMLPTSLWRPG
jgi:putative transposase